MTCYSRRLSSLNKHSDDSFGKDQMEKKVPVSDKEKKQNTMILSLKGRWYMVSKY